MEHSFSSTMREGKVLFAFSVSMLIGSALIASYAASEWMGFTSIYIAYPQFQKTSLQQPTAPTAPMVHFHGQPSIPQQMKDAQLNPQTTSGRGSSSSSLLARVSLGLLGAMSTSLTILSWLKVKQASIQKLNGPEPASICNTPNSSMQEHKQGVQQMPGWDHVLASLQAAQGSKPGWGNPAVLATLATVLTNSSPALAAVAAAPAPEIAAAFNAVTFGPQFLWILMIALPRSPVTRALLEPWGPVIAVALLHLYVDVVGAMQPGAFTELAKFGEVFNPAGDPLAAFRDMLQNPSFVTEEWSHVLAWDLFVGRWIWQDGLKRGIDTRLAVLFCDLTGPPGLLIHMLFCALSGKGLPPPGPEAAPAVPNLPCVPTKRLRADELVQQLFGGPVAGSAIAISNVCAENVVWDDLGLPEPAVGREQVFALLLKRERADLASGGRQVIDRLADGENASGFTWYRAVPGVEGRGLRGTTFIQLDSEGRIVYIREAAEPLAKPGGATAALLKAIAKPGPPSTKEFEQRTPTKGPEVVQYLWKEVQGAPGFQAESLRLFQDDIFYEDFNFSEPFIGKTAVDEFLKEFDIPGLSFELQQTSDGERFCCFTWEIELNLGPEARKVKGLSFYEFVDGKVAYVRDIPEPVIKPPPLQELAALLRPGFRRFSPVPSA